MKSLSKKFNIFVFYNDILNKIANNFLLRFIVAIVLNFTNGIEIFNGSNIKTFLCKNGFKTINKLGVISITNERSLNNCNAAFAFYYLIQEL